MLCSPSGIVRSVAVRGWVSRLVGRATTARAAPAVGTDRVPLRAAAVSSRRPIGPGHCRPRRSGNSDRGSCPGAWQTRGCAPSVSRATGTAHATLRPDASAAGKRSAPAPRPGGCWRARRDSRCPAWLSSSRTGKRNPYVHRHPSPRLRPGWRRLLAGLRRLRLVDLAVPEAVLVEGCLLADHVE